MRSELFAPEFQEKEVGEKYALQSKKLLRVHLDGRDRVIAAAGSMVAYQGNITFGYKGSGSVKNFLKKAVSGEDSRLMTVEGSGEIFFGKEAKDIFTVLLEGEGLFVSSKALLTFDDSLSYDIQMMRSGGAMMGGGLFNVRVAGQGNVALTSDGPPLLLDCSRQPTFVDPQAVLCWSDSLTPSIKNDMNLGTLFGRGSGESFQMAFHGPGFVVLQPSEGVPVLAQASGGSNSGGALGAILENM